MSNSSYSNQTVTTNPFAQLNVQPYGGYTSSSTNIIYDTSLISDEQLIREFRKRNLVDNQIFDKMVVDHKIHQLQDQVKKTEAEIAALIAQKLTGK